MQKSGAADAHAVEFEIAALGECAHNYVTAMLGASHVGKETYIALERCESDLMRYLTSPRGLPEAVVARMMWEVRCRILFDLI